MLSRDLTATRAEAAQPLRQGRNWGYRRDPAPAGATGRPATRNIDAKGGRAAGVDRRHTSPPPLPNSHERPSMSQEGADHRLPFLVVFLSVSAVACLTSPPRGGGEASATAAAIAAAAWAGGGASTRALMGSRRWSRATYLASGAGVNAILPSK